MPRGEPTRTVRLPVWLLDYLAAQTDDVPALIARRMGPQQRSLTSAPGAERCTCPKPTLSRYATNVCTTCKRVRP